MKRIVPILVCLALLFSGCTKQKKEFRITSFAVESVTPKGLTAFDAVLKLGVENPTLAFTIQSASATLYYRGSPFLTAQTMDVSLVARSSQVCDVPITARLEKGVSLFGFMSCVAKKDYTDFTAVVDVIVKLKGGPRIVRSFNVDVGELMKR